MNAATLICLGMAWLAVVCAAVGLPRLAVAFLVGTVDLGLAGQVLPLLDTDPLTIVVGCTTLLTVCGTVASED
ncbi:hypothetical protein [Azospirillum sp.]|uniref:hypothetical protein n=1 Tax=Azospirillum sp. TaxID=34012 RepID=UPI003D74A650